MPRLITVTAPSRLHFGLFGLAQEEGRMYGGVGAMVDQPALKLQVLKEVARLGGLTQEEAERILELRSASAPVYRGAAPAVAVWRSAPGNWEALFLDSARRRVETVESEFESGGSEHRSLSRCCRGEENDLAESLTARLQSHAYLSHRGIADVFTADIDLSFAMRRTYSEAAFGDAWKHRVAIAIGEKTRALAGILEQGDGVAVVVGPRCA
jgi:hypothetical protein